MTSLAEERAEAMARRAKIEEPNKIRGRARNLLHLRWNATPAELEEAIAEKYPKMAPEERETVLSQVLEVQRTERPKVDPATRTVRYQPDPDNLPKTRKKEAPFATPVEVKLKRKKRPEVHANVHKIAQESQTTRETKPLRGLRSLMKPERIRVFDAARKLYADGNDPPLELIRTTVNRATGHHLTLNQARYVDERIRAEPKVETVTDPVTEETPDLPAEAVRPYNPASEEERAAVLAVRDRLREAGLLVGVRPFVHAVATELGLQLTTNQATWLRYGKRHQREPKPAVPVHEAALPVSDPPSAPAPALPTIGLEIHIPTPNAPPESNRPGYGAFDPLAQDRLSLERGIGGGWLVRAVVECETRGQAAEVIASFGVILAGIDRDGGGARGRAVCQ
jgi:hypothetical protein